MSAYDEAARKLTDEAAHGKFDRYGSAMKKAVMDALVANRRKG